MDKKLFVQLNGSRQIIGVLRGYDVFLNIVLDEAVEQKANGEHVKVGTVVIRGNSVVLMEVCYSAIYKVYSYSHTNDLGSGKNLMF